MSLSAADRAKCAAAARAVGLVEDGMRLGLGTGSTAAWFVRLVAARVRREGLSVTAVATSSATARLAAAEGLAVVDLDRAGQLDLTVDGADEVDPGLNLIKGGGAALLQEKIVAAASARMVVIADTGKRVDRLGAFPLPVEIVRFGAGVTRGAVEAALARMDVERRRVTLREGGSGPVVTDEGHYLLDLHLGRIGDAEELSAALNAIPGVVENGLFLGMAESVIYGREDGSTEMILRSGAATPAGGAVDVDELARSLDA
jgi:ribose 5-phosphate isomerase A